MLLVAFRNSNKEEIRKFVNLSTINVSSMSNNVYFLLIIMIFIHKEVL